MTNDKKVLLQMPKDLWADVRKLAINEGDNLNNFIRRALIRVVKDGKKGME